MNLEILEKSAEGLVENVGEVAEQRRHFALVDRVGDGDRIGEEQPHRRGGERDADEREQSEQADAQALQAHQTSRTILPNCPDVSSLCWAAAASASGKVR